MTSRVSKKKLALILTCCFVLLAVSSALIGTLALTSGADAAGEDVVLTGSVAVSDNTGGTDGTSPVLTATDSSATITVTYNLAKGAGATTLQTLYVQLNFNKDLFKLTSLTAKDIGTLSPTITNGYTTAEEVTILWEGTPQSFSSVSGVIVATYQLKSDATFATGEHTFGLDVLDCYALKQGNILDYKELTSSVVADGTKIVTKNAGTITIAADQSFSYNGKPLKAADSTDSPADAATENYVRYTYNGFGQTGAGAITVKWYSTDGQELASAPTAAGQYQIGVSAAAGTGYTAVPEVKQTITVAPQYLNYSASDITVVNSEKPNDAATWTADDFTAPAHTTITTVGTPSGTSGSVTVSVTLQADANYTLNANGTSGDTKAFAVGVTIVNADNGFTASGALTATDKTYDGRGATVSATVKYGDADKKFIYQKKTGVDAWSADLAAAPTDAGTYRVRVEVAAGSTYNAFTSDPVEFTISKAQVKIDGTAVDSAWIAAKLSLSDREYTGSAQTFAATDIVGVPTDLSDIADVTVAAKAGDAQITVGSHTQTVTLTLKSTDVNHTFGADGTDVNTVSGDVTYQITKKTVALPVVADIEYDGKAHTPTSSDSAYTFSSAAQTNAGAYTLTATLTDAANTKWASGDDSETGSVSVSWNITPKPITVTLPNGEMEYSSTFDADRDLDATGKENFLTSIAGILADGDSFENLWKFVVKDAEGNAVTASTPVGDNYVVGMEWKDGVPHNYDVTSTPGTFKITQKVIKKSNIKITEATAGNGPIQKEYDGKSFKLSDYTFTIKIGANDAGDIVELQVPASGIVNANGKLADGTFTQYTEGDAGKYFLEPVLKDTTNYKFDDSANNGFEVQIYQAAVVQTTAGYASMGPNDTEPSITKPVLNVSTDGMVVTIYTDGTCTTVITSGFERAHEYTVKFYLAETNNYGGYEATTTFTIELVGVAKPEVSVAASSVYTGSNPEITIGGVAIGSVNSEAYSAKVVKDEDGQPTVTEYKVVGKYLVIVELKAGFYWANPSDAEDKSNVANITANFEITQAPLTLTISLADGAASTIKEGEAAPGYKVDIAGNVNGENIMTLLGISSWDSYVVCADIEGNEYTASSPAGEYSYEWKKSDGMNKDVVSAAALSNYAVTAAVSNNTFEVQSDLTASGFVGYTGQYDGSTHEILDMTNGSLSAESVEGSGFAIYIVKATSDINRPNLVENWGDIASQFYTEGDFDPVNMTVTDVSDSGTYFVKFVDMDDDAIYCYATITVSITPADNSWTTELTVKDMQFNGTKLVEGTSASTPNNYYAEAANGTVSYKVYSEEACENEITTDIINAGEYWVKAFVPASGNYGALESDATKVSITPAQITVTIDLSAEKDYNGQAEAFPNTPTATEAPSGTVTMKLDGTAPKDVNRDASKSVIPHDVKLIFTWSVTTDTNNYVIKIKDSGDGNKLVEADADGKFTAKYTINPVAVTVTADDKQSACGVDLATLTWQVTDGAVVNGENLSLTLTTNANKNVVADNYVITVAVDDVAVNNNYTITTVNGTYEVTALANVVTLAVHDSGLTYMDSVTSGAEAAAVCQVTALAGTPALQYRKSGDTEWKTFAEAVNGAGFLDAGNWEVKAVVEATGNYQAGESDVQTMTIAKATLKAPTFTYSGATVTWTAVTQTTKDKALDSLVKIIYKINNGQGGDDSSTQTELLTYTATCASPADGFNFSAVAVLKSNDTTNSDNYEILDTKTAAAYSVTFTSNNAAVVSPSEMPAAVYAFSGQTVSAPTAPTATSHTFSKWLSGASEFDFTTPITANTTLVADWTINKYTITWKSNETTVLGTTEVDYGQTPAWNGATPTKAEDEYNTYTFANAWTPELAPATENATYVAVFTATPKAKTITFMVTDGKGVSAKLGEDVTLNVGAAIAPSEEPAAHDYFQFKGWFTDSAMTVAAPSTVSSQWDPTLTLYGKYVLNVGRGDVNGDKTISADDITLYRQYIVGGYTDIKEVADASAAWDLTSGGSDRLFFLTAAELNDDGNRNPRDVSVIRVAIVGGYGVHIASGQNVTGQEIVSGNAVEETQQSEEQTVLQTAADVVNNSAAAENVAMLPVETGAKRRQDEGSVVA